MIANVDGRPEGAGQARLARGGGAAQALSQGGRAQFYPGSPDITEGDALIAYLQMLGTLVDFKLFDDKANLR